MALTKAELAQQAQLKLVNDLQAGKINQTQFQAEIVKINAQILKEQSPTQETAASAITNTPATNSVAQINRQYQQYQVQLANDLNSGKITQAQFQTEFEKLRAQQSAALARVPDAVSRSEKEKLAGTNPLALASGPDATISEVMIGDSSAQSTKSNNQLTPNPLHKYPSYTYGLSLHLLTTEQYNKIVETGVYTPEHVLVASAGRYNLDTTGSATFTRDPKFANDFYFSNMQMNTIIGTGETNRATNAISMEFTLIEPYGLTFLDRLLAASNAAGCPNYLANPYLMQIDFFGADASGNILHPIPNISKHIPINILSMSAKVTTHGSEYKITAQPFNHMAFNESIVGTPFTVEVTAGTINGFFNATTDGATKLADQLVVDERQSDTKLSDKGTNKEQMYNTQSYADALNAFMIKLETTGTVLTADRYYFNFDKLIGEALLFSDSTTSNSESPMDAAEHYLNAIRGDQGTAVAALTFKQRKFPIQQGSSIETIVSMVLRNSKYILDQLVNRHNKQSATYNKEKEAREDLPLNWFKIVPKIKLRDYDPYTNSFAKDITYNVIPYKINNVRNPVAPQGKAKLSDARKNYNYIYTGANDDILDLNIEFNAMYYTSISMYSANQMELSGIPTWVDNGLSCEITNPAYLPGNTNTLTPNQIKYRHTDKRQTASSGAKTVDEIHSADLSSSLATQSGADMLQVELKIVGDPDFIKQDDLFFSPSFDADGSVSLEEKGITPNGSIITDNEEIFVVLQFKTPMDINDTNGLMKFDPTYATSGFSGLYKVLQIDNIFDSGKFTQTLHLVRYPNQDEFIAANTTKERVSTVDGTTQVTQLITASPVMPPPGDANLTNKSVPDPNVTDTPTVDPRLKDIKDNVQETPITTQTEPVAVPPPPTAAVPLPSGVTQDPVSGNYVYKGMTLPPGSGPGNFTTFTTAIDNNKTTQYSYVDNVSGNTINTEFSGDQRAAAINQAEQNVKFAESELARFENKLKTFADFQNPTPENKIKLDESLQRKISDVAAAKSSLAQAQQGK